MIGLDLKSIIGAVAGAALAFVVFSLLNLWIFLPDARKDGENRYIAEQAAADKKADLARKGDDATIQALDDYDLCVAGLRDRKLPISACDVLRGVQP